MAKTLNTDPSLAGVGSQPPLDTRARNGVMALSQFSPPLLIPMFAAQKALVLEANYDGAGVCRSIVALESGSVLITFQQGSSERRMLVTAGGGWGWLQ